jgi:ornithine cyclodeaminase
MTTSPLYLSEDDLRDLIGMPEAIDLLEAAFRAKRDGAAASGQRQRMTADGSVLNVLAGYSGNLVGIKTYTVSQHGAPMHVLVYAADGAGLRAILQAGWLSLLRTGAASGLAARHLSADADRIAIIGTGNQALWQVQGVLAATGASTVTVFSRDPSKRSAFAQRVESLGVQANVASSAREAAGDADVVITMTNAADPVLLTGEVSPNSVLIAAGNNNPARREIDPRLLGEASLIVVDDIAQATTESGEIIAAIEQGIISADALVPLEEVVAGSVRRSHDRFTVFESQGIGLEDIAIAERLLELAAQRTLGRQL